MNKINLYLLSIMVIIFGCQNETPEVIKIDGSNGVRPLVVALVEAFSKVNSQHDIQVGEGMGSKDRLEALKNESIDIAMASHGLDIEALEKDGYQVIRFAQMPVVLAVNQSVEIDNLSEDQICNLYSGNNKNWNEIGGNDLAIQLLSRPFEEVDVEVMLEHLACFSEIELDSMVQFHERSGKLARALAETEGGIGMTTMTRVNQSEGRLKPLALNGFEATLENIRASDYELVRNSYLVIKGEGSKGIKAFLNFVKGAKGQATLMQNEAIPVI